MRLLRIIVVPLWIIVIFYICLFLLKFVQTVDRNDCNSVNSIRESIRERYESREALLQRRSKELENALKSFDSLWSFLVSPNTLYLDRLAAAYQGVELFNVNNLPRILETITILTQERRETNWGLGVDPGCSFDTNWWLGSPCSSSANCARLFRDKSEIRPLLDSTWRCPKEDLKYPVSIQEKNKAPWPWQVEKALCIFLDEIKLRKTDESWFNTIIKMPCERAEQATVIIYAIDRMIRAYPQFTLSIYRNILLNPKFSEAHLEIPWDVGRATTKWLPNDLTLDSKLAYAFIYDVLENSPNPSAKASAESWIVKKIWHGAKQEPQLPFKSIFLLFLSKKVIAEESLKNGNPLDYAFTVAKLAEKPPFDPGRDWGGGYFLNSNIKERIKCLGMFKNWFNENSEEIKEKAKEEANEISAILERLKGCNLCSE